MNTKSIPCEKCVLFVKCKIKFNSFFNISHLNHNEVATDIGLNSITYLANNCPILRNYVLDNSSYNGTMKEFFIEEYVLEELYIVFGLMEK